MEEEKENESFPAEYEPKLSNPDLNLISEADILLTKNVSSSPMVFATKVLYKIFDISELIGHNVSGKTFNKFIKNKQALDERRIEYIRWLVQNNFEANNKEELWKSCRTAINKSIRNNELKGIKSGTNKSSGDDLIKVTHDQEGNIEFSKKTPSQTLLDLQPNMSIFQITNDVPVILDDGLTVDKPKKTTSVSNRSTLVTLTEAIDLEAALTLNEKKFYSDDKKVKPGELKHFLNVVIFQKKLNKFHLEYIIRV